MSIEEDLISVVQGKAVALKNGIDVRSRSEGNFMPVTKGNMCYIVAAVLFDEKDGVLLIQEAKKSCYGTWYLPAGRLEKGETIMDGAKREVKEEAGLECELTALLSVEVNGLTWIRFTFLGQITGGKLKTLEEKDSESLQATFFSKEDIQMSRGNLRHRDCLKLIELGWKYWQADVASRCPVTLPVIAPHNRLIHRVVIIDRSTASIGTMHILAHTEKGLHIPTTLMGQESSVAVSVFDILKEAFNAYLTTPSVRMCGILGLEHRGTGKEEDGMCLTSLVSFDLSTEVSPPSVESKKYQWCPVHHTDLQKRLEDACKGKIVPLF